MLVLLLDHFVNHQRIWGECFPIVTSTIESRESNWCSALNHVLYSYVSDQNFMTDVLYVLGTYVHMDIEFVV